MSMTYTTSYGRASDCHAGRCRDISVSRRDWSVLIAGRAMEYAGTMSQHRYHHVTRTSTCQYCGCGIIQIGSGRHKRNCGSKVCRAAKDRAKRGPAIKRYSRRKHIYGIKLARVGCMDCLLLITEDTMSVFEMDHRDPTQKVFEINHHWATNRTAKEIDDEALKCDMVCANCHRMRTKRNNDIAKGKTRRTSVIEPVRITQFASLLDCPEWDVA